MRRRNLEEQKAEEEGESNGLARNHRKSKMERRKRKRKGWTIRGRRTTMKRLRKRSRNEEQNAINSKKKTRCLVLVMREVDCNAFV